MQDYFLSIGLCLFKGKEVGKPEFGWMVTASIVYGDHCRLFSGKTLVDVKRWWRERVAILDTEDRAMRVLLGRYKTASTEELEAIATWSGAIGLTNPAPPVIAGVPVVLSDLVAEKRSMSQFHCPPPWGWPAWKKWPTPLPAFIGKKYWWKKAARLYVRGYKKSGGIRRGPVHRRIARLARRACQERIRCLPIACNPGEPRPRL